MKAEETITCPYGDENCTEEFEDMCDDCKSDAGQAHYEGMMDTYD